MKTDTMMTNHKRRKMNPNWKYVENYKNEPIRNTWLIPCVWNMLSSNNQTCYNTRCNIMLVARYIHVSKHAQSVYTTRESNMRSLNHSFFTFHLLATVIIPPFGERFQSDLWYRFLCPLGLRQRQQQQQQKSKTTNCLFSMKYTV